ncbi:MAG: hypothetical protein HXY40_18820, partial [Chloroflexi bacterium]|nr:hypothetical protein [Chloroflexota bacterium]
PQPVAQPEAPAPSAAATPDFDSMSPEEIMRWMESLAKRQGAYEGFTTPADMQVAEIDPDTVVIDEPGYVPYGQETKKPEEAPVKPAAAAKPAPAPTPAPKPAAAVPPPPAATPPPLERFLEAEEDESTRLAPAASLTPSAAPAPTAAVEQDALSWLESFSAGQGDEVGLDLSGLAADVSAPAAPAAADPMAWLEGLAQGPLDLAALESAAPAAPAAPPVGDDPMAWLENLARTQGAKTEELITTPTAPKPAREESVTVPAEPIDAGFSVSDDPAAWLDQLATSKGASGPLPPLPSTPKVEVGDADVIKALTQGKDVEPTEIADFFNQMMDRAAARTDVSDYIEEPEEAAVDVDAPAVQGEIPDWLLESVGTPPPAVETPPAAQAAVPDMPDWLKEEAQEAEQENIFAVPAPSVPELPTVRPAAPVPPRVVETPATPQQARPDFLDTNDQWIEAFEQEYQEKYGSTPVAADLIITPEPAAPQIVPPAMMPPAASDLPEEEELTPGEIVPLPDWLNAAASAAPAEAFDTAAMPDWLAAAEAEQAATATDLPDWLKEAAVEPSNVPSWLIETMPEEEAAAPVEAAVPPAPVPVAVVVPAPAPVVTPPPAPKPVPPPAPVRPPVTGDVAGLLAAARQKVSAGDIENGLLDYEGVVRSGAALNMVIDDVRSIISVQRENPAALRVLGDALMRSGQLQEALDTYRKALNLL